MSLPVHFDLHRLQARKGAPRDDLRARSVGAWQQYEQLPLGESADAVEAAQLARERRRDVGDGLLGDLLSVLVSNTVGINTDVKGAQRGALPLRSLDLLAQSRKKLGRACREDWALERVVM